MKRWASRYVALPVARECKQYVDKVLSQLIEFTTNKSEQCLSSEGACSRALGELCHESNTRKIIAVSRLAPVAKEEDPGAPRARVCRRMARGVIMGLGALHPALVHTTPRRPMRFLQCRHSRFITFLFPRAVFKLLD